MNERESGPPRLAAPRTVEARGVSAAEVLLPAHDLDAEVAFFAGLGFRLDAIGPADAPVWAVLAGHGLRLRLDRALARGGASLRLLCREPDAVAGGARTLASPHGTRIELVTAEPPLLPLPGGGDVAFAVHRAAAQPWRTGRAGMRYRDLVPDRLGGALIASHIAIDGDGPVPDYVHFHRVRLQLIHCVRGSARLVYEDQGEPFDLLPGDCVLQPPGIRHRVLESRGGLEVIEISSPAEHATGVDHELSLPNGRRPGRTFGGQRFVHARAAEAAWQPLGERLLERDFGIAAATGGLARVRIVRADAHPGALPLPAAVQVGGGAAVRVVLAGRALLRGPGAGAQLERFDAWVTGTTGACEISVAGGDFSWLEVAFA
jgi:mannose-6-phosphate isomerase-like protein (cupin superfamily)